MRRETTIFLLIVAIPLTCAGCGSGIHRRGEHQVTLLGSYDHPIKGQAIWPDGDGRADNAGVAVGYNYFLTDRFSVGGAITPYRNYNQSDGDAAAAELQVALRYHFADFEIVNTPVGLYAELLGGMMQSSASVPEAGSHTNFTQDAGVGMEVRLGEGFSWLTGYRLRHVSNGYIFSDKNPSQNDHQVYTGLAFSW